MKVRGIIPILCATLNAAPPLDDAHGPLLRAYPDSLRWFNLERLPSWCGGAKVTRRGPLHVFHLQEGQSLLVPMPAAGWLRAVPTAREVRGRLAVALTDGSGLSCGLADQGDPGGQDALFGPASDQPALFKVSCPRDGRGVLEVALFVSRVDAAGLLPPYSERLDLPGPTVRLARQGELQSEVWHGLDPQRPVELQVTGPARVQVEMRLKPGRNVMRDGLRFALSSRLDGNPGTQDAIRTAVDIHEPLLLDGHPARLGRPEQHWVDVPSGTHRLTLDADHALLVRVHKEGPGSYLLAGRNCPSPWIPEVLPPVPDRDSTRLAGIEALANDLRFRVPGLSALAHLDHWRHEHPEDRALREARNRKAAEWTTFRTLLPENLPAGALRPAFAWLRTPTANPLPPARKAGAPADLEQALAGLPQAVFLPLTADAVFHLDPRESPTELRLLVEDRAAQANRRLWIQVGELQPMEVTLGAPIRFPAAWEAPTIADLGLALAAQDRGWRAQPLLQGSERVPHLPPLPVVAAGDVQIPLPADVRRVRLWADPAPGAPPVFAALQIRTSARPEVPCLGPALSDAEAIRRHLELSEGESVDARSWLPLRRWLRSQSDAFRARVNLDPVMVESLKGRPIGDAHPLLARGRSLEAEGHRLAAVVVWAEAFRGATGAQRAEALAGLFRALWAAGEPFLAEQWAKAALIHGDPSLREPAVALLEGIYLAAAASTSRLALLAAAADGHPSTTRLVPLAAALLEDGQPHLALQALTLMPPAAAPELWVRAGRLVRSEHILAAGLKALQDPEGRKLWEGILCLDEGRGAEASEAMAAAGQRGAPWRRAREEALELAPELMRNPAEPGLHEAWSRWTLEHPGPWSWRTEPWLVKEAAGAAQLRNVSLDQAQAAFRCEPGRPVRLQVVGPARLRVEAYPRHAAGTDGELEGRLDIGGSGWRRSLPFTQNWPAPGLRVEGPEAGRPGQRVQCDLDLPPGLHELDIGVGEASAWIIPSVFRPEVPLGPLPQRSPEVLKALLATNAPPPRNATPMQARPGVFLADEDRFICIDLEALRQRILAPLPPATEWVPGPMPAAARPNGDTFEGLGSAPEPDTSEARAVAARLDALATAVQGKPEAAQAGLALAEHLVFRCPEALLHTRAMDLLRRGAVWTPAGHSGTGAGLRLVPSSGFQPQASATRVRQALLADPGDRILAAQEAVVYTVQQPSAWTLTLEVAAFVPSLAQPLPAVLRVSLDGKIQDITLEPSEGGLTIQLPVPAGRHTLRLELEKPFEGQWIRIRFPAGLGQGSLEQAPRSLEVARREAPVRFQAQGPLWVRCDRWRPTGPEPEYRFLPPGIQEWTILPAPGEDEVLCTFSYQEILTDRPLPASRPWSMAVRPVPGGPPAPLAESPAFRSFRDAFPLGGQEDGTHAVHVRAFSRVDPVGSPGAAPMQRGVEVGYHYRFLDADADRFQHWKARVRHLDGSGVSLGLGGLLDMPLLVNPLRGFGSASLIVQAGAGPGASRALASAIDLEAGVRLPLDLGRRTSHAPELSFFWRTLGYEHVTPQLQTKLDLDLWSPFRDRNPWGLKASESLRHRPWQDTLLTAQVSTLVTCPQGEGVTLAVTALQGGWRQRLGALEAVVQGGVARYGGGALATAPFTRSHLLAGLEGTVWTARQNLLTIGAEVRLDAERRLWTGSFSLAWSFGNGRGLRDFARGERAFPHADGRILSQGANNGWKELPR